MLATGKSLCDHDVEREGQPNGSIEANGFENRLIRGVGKCIELHGSLEPIKSSEMLRGNMPLQAKVGPWRCLRPACDLGMGCSQRRPLAKVSLFGSDEVTGVKRTCNQWCMLIYNDLYISMHLIILKYHFVPTRSTHFSFRVDLWKTCNRMAHCRSKEQHLGDVDLGDSLSNHVQLLGFPHWQTDCGR